MDTLIILAAFLGLGLFIIVAFEMRERRRAGQASAGSAGSAGSVAGEAAEGPGRAVEAAEGPGRAVEARADADGGECCGMHLVCERDTLLQTNAVAEYFDDEELDALAGIAPEEFTEAQYDMIAEVFTTLQESEVAAWVRSLQLRNIRLPEDLREQALMIVRERRGR